MLWAAITAAFFGFLRSFEFCSTSSNSFVPHCTPLFRDVSCVSTNVFLFLKTSKTAPFRECHTLRFTESGASVCPVRALWSHLQYCNAPEQPLFNFVSGSYLTRQELSDTLKRLLPSVSEDSLSSQSFRIRAATPAAAAGVPDWFIKVLGRWSSDCYEWHIKTPSAIFDRMPSMLCSVEGPNYERWQP